jgi:hypothetical protein
MVNISFMQVRVTGRARGRHFERDWRMKISNIGNGKLSSTIYYTREAIAGIGAKRW